ncbi:MAG: N-acetylmuramoyl-L-alanine amidase [Pseudomonadota bacterium]
MRNSKINESTQLATRVQNTMVKELTSCYPGIKNLGVKQAPFYVLLGARMPSILVEVGFISNKEECKKLMSQKYRETLIQAIFKGIEKYAQALKAPDLTAESNIF